VNGTSCSRLSREPLADDAARGAGKGGLTRPGPVRDRMIA
jgi:hypothetical protein